MSFGLRVWSAEGKVRLDTSDRTMRLTSSIYVPARMMAGNASVFSEVIYIPNFVPDIDGAFLIGAEGGELNYDSPEGSVDGFLPEFAPEAGGVRITWRGYGMPRAYTIRYMPFYIVVLRKQ